MVHHNLWDIPRSPMFDDGTQEAWVDFVEANRAFAQALAQEADKHPVYLIQDYHLCLVPAMLREMVPDAKIVHFSHTPFAGATYLAVLPVAMRTAILRGLAGADVIGFQSKHWAENYLLSARSLPELRVLRGGRLEVDGRTAAVRSFPVAVSAEPLRETANRPEADEVRTDLREWAGDSRIMLRVDRLEPSKNILRGFLAYELFLRRNPSWVGSVRFLCLFSPSREDVPEYQNYGEECLAQAERINAEFGTTTWQPIEVRVQEDYAFAVAAYDLYDVLFVNPTYDGMNLVAMEGPLVNRRNGVLVLSRNAGAFSRLGRQSLGVNPFDLAETAEAIREALEMPDEERARRARGLARTVQAHTPANWLADQLEAVDQVRPPRRRR
jgi:trehalose 6-phosphate synthase